MADWNPEVNELFAKVIELDSPDAQRALLDETCGDNADLRAGVERLLQAHHDAGSFLNRPPDGLAPTITTGEHHTVDDSGAEFSLEFLTPTDKPNCLGTLGQYEAIEAVGRGGMGLVLRAYDTKLNRVVAIKVMAPELAANPMAVKRFLREARAAAAVSHEHVVTIFAIEEENKPPFIVMEFVDGKSLQEKVDEAGALELKEILRIGMQTARGLAAAHEQGLVHRDVKPANILLENGVERVKLTDFGLARATDDVSVTQTGQIAGTPQYMSPEQAEGKTLDARSDLFSLGSVLYTMCTGRPPFRADSAVAMLRRVTEDDARPIREINIDIPEWLESIIAKLLAKNPDQRFESADEVASLLGQHLAHEQDPQLAPLPASIEAPSEEVEDFHSTFSYWNLFRWLVLPGVMTGALFSLGDYLVMPGLGTVTVDSDDDSVVVAIHKVRHHSVGDRIESGVKMQTELEQPGTKLKGSISTTLSEGTYFAFLPKRSGEFELNQNRFTLGRGQEVKIRVHRRPPTLPRMHMERRFGGHTATVAAVDISRDGTLALSASGWPDSDGTLRLWDVRSAQEIKQFKGHDGPIVRAFFSPDGKRIIAGGTKRNAFVYDVETAELVATLGGFKSDFRHGIALLPDGEHALIGEGVGSVHICRIDTGEVVQTLKQPDDKVMAIAVSRNGTRALATSGDEVYVWNLETRERVGRFRQHSELVQSVAFSHDGSKAVSASIDRTIRVWDVETQEQLQVLEGHTAGVLCARFTQNDERIISGSHDSTIRGWDVESGKQTLETKDSRRSIWSVAITPDGQRVLSGGGQQDKDDRYRLKDFDLRLWRLPNDSAQKAASVKPTASDDWVDLLETVDVDRDTTGATWQREGNDLVLASGQLAGLQVTDDVPAMYEVRSRFYRREDGGSIKFWLPIPGGHAGLSFNDWFKFHGLQHFQGKLLRDRVSGPAMAVGDQFELNERHQMLARVERDGQNVRIVVTLDGMQLFDWCGAASTVAHDKFIDFNGLGLGCGLSPGIVWETLELREVASDQHATIEEVRRFALDDLGRTIAAEVSPDGNHVALGSLSGKVAIVDLRTSAVLVQCSGHEQSVQCLTFNKAGSSLYTASSDSTVRIWDAKNGRETGRFSGHTGWVSAIAASSDGKYLVTGSRWYDHEHGDKPEDNTLRVWDPLTKQELRQFDGVKHPVYQIHFSRDGKLLAACGEGALLAVWDVQSGDLVHQLQPGRSVASMAISPDAEYLAYFKAGYRSDYNGVRPIIVYNLRTQQESMRLLGHHSRVSSLAFTSDGRHLISASGPAVHKNVAQPDCSIRIWDLSSGLQSASVILESSIHSISLTPNGHQLVSAGGSDETSDVRLWKLPESVWPVASDRELIQGTWRRVSVVTNGKDNTGFDRDELMTIDGDTFFEPGNEKPRRGKIVLDPTTNPRQVDVHIPVSMDNDLVLRGIYKIEEDRLTVFQQEDWTKTKRPTNFIIRADDNCSLIVYERVPDDELLQGAWRIVGLESSGQTAPESMYKDKRFLVQGDRISLTGIAEDLRPFQLNSDTSPKRIDIAANEENRFDSKAIYELNGNTLKFCFSQQTKNPRPASIETEGTVNFCYTLKRALPPSDDVPADNTINQDARSNDLP